MTKHIRASKMLLLSAALLVYVIAADVRAQDGGGLANPSIASWINLDAPPGREFLATDVIMRSMRGWKRDELGNLILRKGSGSPRRVIACALDRPGFAVTEITDDVSCDTVCCTLVCRGPGDIVTRLLKCSTFEICRRSKSSFIPSRPRLEGC